MNISDLIHKAVTGEWRIDRMRAQQFLKLESMHGAERTMRFYAGAEPGNKRPSPAILSTPEDYKQAYQRIILIRAARQMEEDLPFFDGILGDFETYVVGDLKYSANTGDKNADKVINDFCEWQFNACDLSDRLDLTKLSRLGIRSYKRDGECGFTFVDQGDSIKINAVSGDRIGNPMVGANIGPDNYNGIIVDLATGAPVIYQIYRRLPKLNAYVPQFEVSASDFRHYYSPFRYEQYHGVTVFMNAIEHAFDMKQIIDFTKLNIKWRSAQLPYVTNEQGRPRGNSYETQAPGLDGVPEPLSIKVDGVTQSFLKLSEGVMEYPNDFPNGQFVNLMNELKRECAVGAKLPLEFCYQSQTGGVIQRFFADKAKGTFDEEKRWMKRVLLNPFKNRVIQKGIQTGFLDLRSFGNLSTSLARFKGTWQMGRAISVDYAKEAKADIDLIDAGLMSPDEYVSEQGGDLQMINQRIENQALTIMEAAKRVSASSGVAFDVVLPYLSKKFPNPSPPTQGKTGQNVDKPGMGNEDDPTA